MDLKNIDNKITEFKKINAGTYVKIWREFKRLRFKIILNKYPSFKLPKSEKIKKITKLAVIHIEKDNINFKYSILIILIEFKYKVAKNQKYKDVYKIIMNY